MSSVIDKMIRIADVLDRDGKLELAGQVDLILRLASTQPYEFERMVLFMRKLQKQGMSKEKVVKMFSSTPIDPEVVMFAWVAASMLDKPVPEEWIHKDEE